MLDTTADHAAWIACKASKRTFAEVHSEEHQELKLNSTWTKALAGEASELMVEAHLRFQAAQSDGMRSKIREEYASIVLELNESTEFIASLLHPILTKEGDTRTDLDRDSKWRRVTELAEKGQDRRKQINKIYKGQKINAFVTLIDEWGIDFAAYYHLDKKTTPYLALLCRCTKLASLNKAIRVFNRVLWLERHSWANYEPADNVLDHLRQKHIRFALSALDGGTPYGHDPEYFLTQISLSELAQHNVVLDALGMLTINSSFTGQVKYTPREETLINRVGVSGLRVVHREEATAKHKPGPFAMLAEKGVHLDPDDHEVTNEAQAISSVAQILRGLHASPTKEPVVESRTSPEASSSPQQQTDRINEVEDEVDGRDTTRPEATPLLEGTAMTKETQPSRVDESHSSSSNHDNDSENNDSGNETNHTEDDGDRKEDEDDEDDNDEDNDLDSSQAGRSPSPLPERPVRASERGMTTATQRAKTHKPAPAPKPNKAQPASKVKAEAKKPMSRTTRIVVPPSLPKREKQAITFEWQHARPRPRPDEKHNAERFQKAARMEASRWIDEYDVHIVCTKRQRFS